MRGAGMVEVRKMNACLVLGCLVLAGGCVLIPYPHRVTDAPEVSGVVFDAKSGAPCAGARVLLSEYALHWRRSANRVLVSAARSRNPDWG